MSITIRNRPAKIGKHVNTRTEFHGEESHPAVDIPIEGLMLDSHELNALLEDPKAHGTLFRTAPGGPIEPRFRSLKAFALAHSFDKVQASLSMSFTDERLELSGELAAVKLEPCVGGLTELSGALRWSGKGVVDLDKLPQLMRRLAQPIEIELHIGPAKKKPNDAQGSLPLVDKGASE